MLVYPSAIDLSSSALRFLARQLAVHRQRIGSCWRRLTPGRQALLALAHLRCGDTYTRLAAGFGIGLATVCRYVDRIAADRPFYSGAPAARHEHPGDHRPARSSAVGLAGPARLDALTNADITCFADRGYQGARRPVRVPFRGRRLRPWQRRANNAHAKTRCVGEQAMAALKGWRLLRKLRCSTTRITDIVKAVIVLHHAST